MKVLVIGGGGREHALVWKLRQSPQVSHLWCAPGNAGIARQAECLPADPGDAEALAALAGGLKPDLTVVGPELPLVNGVVDAFAARGLRIVGPTRHAAQLEGSKIFAKEFMQRHNIPTAPLYGVYDSVGDAYAALCAVDWPCVIKADGLAAGKGVLVAPGPDEATSFLERVMDKREFGAAGDRVLMEEALSGEELSYIVLTDGETILPLAPTQDHKRLLDGNQGPNTGGMGAYSEDSLLNPQLETAIRRTIVEPAIRGMAAEGHPYRGFLYFGLMLTPAGPQVLEFNCRMGDPETQSIVARMDFDLAEACLAACEGRLGSIKPSWKPAASACVVMAARGYPENPEKGKPIEGLEMAATRQNVAIFHAGTKEEGGVLRTSGGRVLGVTGWGDSLSQVLTSIYDVCSNIAFDGAHFRKDIGAARLRQAGAGGR